MNSCFIDAVVYIGANGDSIRSGMRQAACELIGGVVPSSPPSGAAKDKVECRPAKDRKAGASSLVLAPESLGSIMLFDAYNALKSDSTLMVQDELAKLKSVYLLSNQIPLLSLGNVPANIAKANASPLPETALAQLLANTNSNKRLQNGENIQVVAFSDPNDMFSYRLQQKHVGDPDGADNIELTNVLVSNDKTYLGLVENPLNAHRGYERDQVFNMLLNGSAVLD